ncbi:MAG: PAS domain S-box protein [bacterium]|nr:PAS domain S-box protein [bacterium]
MKDKDKTKEQLINELVEMRQRITELKSSEAEATRTEEELREAHEELEQTKQYLERLIESSPDAIVSTDQEGAVTFFSLGAETLLGYEQEEILGQSVTLLYEDEDRAKEVMRRMREGGGTVAGFETTLRAKDGSLIPALISASILYDEEGQEAGTVGFNKDLRERKEAEVALQQAHKELQQAQQYLERLIESSPDAIISANREGLVTFWSSGAEALLGYRQVEILGQHVTRIYESEDHAKAVMHQMREGGGTVSSFETTLCGQDGSLIPVLISASMLYDEEGQEVGTVGFNKDLRERKEAEEALRQAEEKYRNIFEHAIEGIFQTTSDGRYISANPALARIYGYDSIEELSKDLTDIGRQLYVDPDRRTEFAQLLHEHDAVKEFESPVYRKDGSVIWISENARAVRNPSGALLYYEGTVGDITERKQAEETMRLANERMRQQLESARIIQQSFLPGQLPGADDPRYSLAAANYPAASVGGDYYDVIELGRNRLALVLGDVSGKGVPGAIYMARLVSDFRFLVEPHDDSPAETLTALNRLLQDRGQPGMFVTLLYLTLDLDTGVVTFANAGHLPLLIRRAIGKVESVVGDAGPPLGIIDNIAYNDSFLSLQPGEDMLLYTDGVTEAMNAAQEQFTEERLLEILLRTHPRLENIITSVTEEVKTFTGDATSNDDLTLLAARWEGEDA